MLNLPVGALAISDPIGFGNFCNFLWAPCKEGPTRRTDFPFCSEPPKGLRSITFRIDGDGDEAKLSPHPIPHGLLNAEKFCHQNGTNCCAVRVQESDQGRLALQILETEPLAVLVDQPEASSLPRKPTSLSPCMLVVMPPSSRPISCQNRECEGEKDLRELPSQITPPLSFWPRR